MRNLTARRTGAYAAVAGMLIAGVVTSGCGREKDSASSASSSGKPSLTVAVGVPNPAYAQPYIAQLKGFFKDAGVSVTLRDNTASNTANVLAAGKADLALYASGVPIALSQQGKQASIVYSFAGNATGGTLVGGKAVTRLDQVKGKRIAVLAKGSATYGWANLYNQRFKLHADLVPFQDNAAIQGALTGGRVAAAGGPYANFAGLLDGGRANMLIDSRDPAQREKYLGAAAQMPEGVIFGITDVLRSKRDAVIRFLKAIERARKYIASAPDAQVAKDLRTFPAFQTTPEPLLTSIVKNVRQFVDPKNGFISKPAWNVALQQFSLWGIDGYTPSAGQFAYDSAVDMSYYDAAIGRPTAAAK